MRWPALLLAGVVAACTATPAIHTDRPAPRHLPLPQQDDCFFFAIFGDRTGGKPKGIEILEQAVSDTNLLGPDLVMTVGDLIQGYNRPEQWQKEADEFKAVMSRLRMPWYPVAGNHDVYQRLQKGAPLTNENAEHYEREFGPLWYWFRHKGSAFVVLYSDEGEPGTRRAGFRHPKYQKMSPAQLAWLDKTLAATRDADHVFVFLHHPRWRKGGYGDDWEGVHARLARSGNVRAVFAGHIHHMVYGGVRDGIAYYTLAATGSSLRAGMPARAGFLHHFNLVTVREDEVLVTAIPVGAVLDPKLLDEPTVADIRKLDPGRLKIPLPELALPPAGPLESEYRFTVENPCRHPIEVTAIPTSPDRGWAFTPDHVHATIPPGGSAPLTFSLRHPGAPSSRPHFGLRIDYLGAALRIEMPERTLKPPKPQRP